MAYDATKMADWQIAQEAEKNMPTPEEWQERLGLKKDEVMAYCKRLIQEVGKGGGFILSSGCSIPANARPENVRALYEAAEEWGGY